MPEMLYTADNCRPAYQLRWSLTLFEKRLLPPQDAWLEPLENATERDAVRILEVAYQEPKCWLFLLSTAPTVSPAAIVKSVKGRWQHLIRSDAPRAFQRNFSLTSVGDANCDMASSYVDGQIGHHDSATEPLLPELDDYQWHCPETNLSVPYFSSHGRYITNLHLVLEHTERDRISDASHWHLTRNMLRRAAASKQHRLSNAGILPDHLHLFAGINHHESPQHVALGYMNNLAYAHGMQPVYSHGYYAGTIGPYHMQAIRKVLGTSSPTDAASVEE